MAGMKLPPFSGIGSDPYDLNTGFKVNRDGKKTKVEGYNNVHPFNNEINHEKLLQHLKQRLDLSRQLRNELNIRLRNIDMDINGFVNLSDDDRDRMLQNRRGKSQKPTDVSLPLAMSKIDDLLTFMMEIFFPSSSGMFGAETSKNNQTLANAFVADLNQQGKDKGYYHKFGKFLFECLKYNVGVMCVEWCQEKGFKLGNDAAKRLQIQKDQTVFEGNILENVDIYNFFYDPTVQNISEIPEKAEWAAWAMMFTRFKIQKMAIAGELHGVENWIATASPQTASLYYQERPVVRFDYNANTGSVDWIKFAAGDLYSTIGWGVEIVKIFVWLNPKQFGLSTDDELQIWRIYIANNLYICHAEHMDNAHNMLPVLVANPLEDNLGLQRKSPAELLLDSNRFASFLMNVHQQSARTKLYGLTVYDPNGVDLSNLGEDTSGRVPLLPQGWGKDIKTMIAQFKEAPETTETVNDIKGMIDLMEYILPTNQQKQVADLDRATTYQAAATVQGTNRRSLKAAKVIDDQAANKMRMMMMWNTLQYKQSINVLNDQTGKMEPQPVANFREKNLEYDTGDGIQSIDRIMLVHLLHDIINSMLQSQEAQKQVDIVGLIDYWVKLFGVKIDINQFKYPQQTNPQQQQQQENDQQAQQQQVENVAQLAQAHGATAPQPVTPGQNGQNAQPQIPPEVAAALLQHAGTKGNA